MSLFGSPAPQWTDLGVTAALATRLVPVRYGDGWILTETGNTPDGAFVEDAGAGGIIIDDTITVGLKPTRLPSGGVIIY